MSGKIIPVLVRSGLTTVAKKMGNGDDSIRLLTILLPSVKSLLAENVLLYTGSFFTHTLLAIVSRTLTVEPTPSMGVYLAPSIATSSEISHQRIPADSIAKSQDVSPSG